jgi:hypothetical protein
MLADDLVAERLIEQAVPWQLAANADSNLGNSRPTAVLVNPVHQGPAKTASLEGRVDRHPVDIQMIRPPLKPQAGNESAIQPVQESVIAGQILPYVIYGLAKRAAGRIEPAVASESRARQPVELAGGLRTA